jgi:hypothetical protein
MGKVWFAIGAAAWVGACSPYPGYEASVADKDPIYCYRTFSDHMTSCYATPYHRDRKNLVNYFGPGPQRYEPPPPPPPERLVAPPMIQYWVKDQEPIPRADPPKRM